MRRELTSTWLSGHLFFEGSIYSTACDKIIKSVIQPFVDHCEKEQWITRYFFIRYAENGSHVRIRLYGDHLLLEKKVKSALVSYVKEEFPRGLEALPSFNNDVPEDHEMAAPNLYWIPYEPEYERYGGIAGVDLAERFFFASSKASMVLLEQIDGKHESARQGKGLLATLILAHAFMPDWQQLILFNKSYCSGYLERWVGKEALPKVLAQYEDHYNEQKEALIPHVEAVLSMLLDSGKSLSEVLDAYYADCLAVREHCRQLFAENQLPLKGMREINWKTSMQALLRSYVHMMNNRLGLSIPDETYLAYIISRTLEDLTIPVTA